MCSQQRCCKAYCPCYKKVAGIKGIVLALTRGQDPLLLLQGKWRDHTHKHYVTRFIALITTKWREIVLTTPMSQDSERSHLQGQCCIVLATPMLRDSERSCSRGQCRKTIATTKRSRGLAKDPDTDVARPKEIALARATLSSLSLRCCHCHCRVLPWQSQSPDLALAEGLGTRFCGRATLSCCG